MDNKIVLVIAAILLPPLSAFLKVGMDKHFFINIILTILGFFPGILHALWLIFREN